MRKKWSKNYSFAFSLGQLILLSILLLLLCGIIFSLGLVGGYGMFASSLRQQLPEQKEVAASWQKSEQASFYDTLRDEAPSTKTTVQVPKPASNVTTSYQIQIGAFRQQKEARTLKKRLQNKGYQVNINKVDLKDKGVWFRVRVGNCANMSKAEELAKKLQKKEHLPTLIVKPE